MPIRAVSRPAALDKPDEMRLPAERQQILFYEKEARQAAATVKRDRNERVRQALLLAQRSVSENPPHEVFEQLPVVNMHREFVRNTIDAHRAYTQRRSVMLDAKQGSQGVQQTALAMDAMPSPIPRGKAYAAGPKNTFSFAWMQEIPDPPRSLQRRAQEIRNYDTAGRKYNILAPDKEVRIPACYYSYLFACR
eukprot:TRINITY_DN1828_c0_g1_i2.p1 TRINITY_DN1828_c0_g1~~TRINITY_DN1828_c0_g1_i2.p1  ORF type:complete len:193 (-),score=46.40 TRINITY_DN1828_c0_g1_i2:480-1058(-)